MISILVKNILKRRHSSFPPSQFKHKREDRICRLLLTFSNKIYHTIELIGVLYAASYTQIFCAKKEKNNAIRFNRSIVLNVVAKGVYSYQQLLKNKATLRIEAGLKWHYNVIFWLKIKNIFQFEKAVVANKNFISESTKAVHTYQR